MRQPPEKSSTAVACAVSLKPRPDKMAAARAGAASASMTRRRSWRSALFLGGSVVKAAEQCGALGVGFEHGFEQRLPARWGLLADGAEPGGGGNAYNAAIRVDLAGDGAQQGGFAGPVATDKSDAGAGGDGQIGAVEQSAAANAQGQRFDCEQAHAWVRRRACPARCGRV